MKLTVVDPIFIQVRVECATYSSPTTPIQYTIHLGLGEDVFKLFGYATFPC
jgi:hypothetical protein